MIAISHAGLSDIGRVRKENQDRWFADPHAGIYLVADGIGGTAAGAVTAQIVMEVLPRLLRHRLEDVDNLADFTGSQSVVSTIAELSDRLRTEAKKEYGAVAVGSTVVLAVIRGHQALIAHLGDSRAYLFHKGTLEQLTHDHSLVQTLIDSGDITAKQAEHHPGRGQLTRHVGMPSNPLPEAREVRLAIGDGLLLCSDGMSGAVTSDQLTEIMERHADPSEACRHLVSAANDCGGRDEHHRTCCLRLSQR